MRACAHSSSRVRMSRSILLCQIVEGGGGVGPGQQAAVDDVGEVALEGAAGFAGGFAFGDLAGQGGLGGGGGALFGGGGGVERGGGVGGGAAGRGGGGRG